MTNLSRKFAQVNCIVLLMKSGSGRSSAAVDLDLAIQRLRGRIRSESGLDNSPWSRSQLSALDRIVHGPPSTASDLAAAESMRPQSMAAVLGPMEQEGLLVRHRDPQDGRRMLIAATETGREVLQSVLELRNAWLTAAVDHVLRPEEYDVLPVLVDVLNRLADCEVPPVARRAGRSRVAAL